MTNQQRNLPQNQEALVAVLQERFDAIDQAQLEGKRRSEGIEGKLNATLAAQSELKAEILKNREETALLTKQVHTQNGSVAEAVRDTAGLTTRVFNIEAWQVNEVAADLKRVKDHLAQEHDTTITEQARWSVLKLQLYGAAKGLGIATSIYGLLRYAGVI